MNHRSLILFTAFSLTAHAAAIGLTASSDTPRPTSVTSTVEIGLVSLPTIEQEFSHDQAPRLKTAPSAEQPPSAPPKTAPQPPETAKPEPPAAFAPTTAAPPRRAAEELTPQPDVSETSAAAAPEAAAPETEATPSPRTATRAAPLQASNPAPAYPAKALRYGWEGEVWLEVRVDRFGDVSRVSVEQGSGYRLLDQAAVKAVRNWKFAPARIGDTPTEGTVRVPISFRIRRS